MAQNKEDMVFNERVEMILELLCHGSTKRAILQYVTTKTDWNATPQQVEKYITTARKQLAGLSKANREEEIGLARLRYEHLYSRSLAIQDFKTCKAIQDNICNLLGLSNIAPDNKAAQAEDAINAFLNSSMAKSAKGQKNEKKQ